MITTNEDILEIASHDLIRNLEAARISSYNENCSTACAVACMSILAVRDSIKRHKEPKIYKARMDKIRKLLNSKTGKS